MSFRSKLFQLTLLPILISVLILALALNVFFSRQMDDFILDKGRTSSMQIARLISPLLDGSRTEDYIANSLGFSLPAALEETAIRAVRVYNAEGKILNHSGPEFQTDTANSIPDKQTPTVISGTNSSLFTQPVTPRNSTAVNGWVQVEVAHQSFVIPQYQMLLITALVILLTLAFGVAVTLYTSRRTYQPLEQIHTAVENIGKGDFDINLQIPQGGAFARLAESLSRSANYLKQSRQELIDNMEQTNQDLRESLDTVEIKNMELNMARREALEASRTKSEFLANTSHEIRTPINGILGFTGLLMKTKLSAQQKEYLQTIQKSSQGLLALINDILDVSKMETGKLVLDYAPFNIRETIEDTLQILAPVAAEKNCQLITLIEPKTPIYLLGDGLRLKQVMTNLVNNAVKFSEDGNIVVRLSTLESKDNQVQLKISVEDEGMGIAPEQLTRLFHAFTQGDTSHSRRQGGAGLGLTVAKGLIEKMHGKIHVESQTGKGSLFWFSARFGLDENATGQRDCDQLAGKTLLICDDNAAATEQLQSYFDSWQVNYLNVEREEDILPALEKHGAVDCLVWDIYQQKNGRQWAADNPVIQYLTKHNQCDVILLSMPGCDLDYTEQEDDSVLRFVHKPLTHDSLYEVLCEQLVDDPEACEEKKQARPGLPQPHILAVDDNAANLQLIGELLKDLNADVTLAKDGEEALQICQNQQFDLIFMDIQMPGIDGLETTRRLRASETAANRTPVVALTAHAMTDQKPELLLAGLDDYLSKPVTEDQLKHVIHRWTQQARREQKPVQPITDTAPIPAVLQTAAPDEPPVDISRALELSNNKAKLARDMLAILLNNLPDEKTKITDHYKQQNFEALATVVHKLNGGASYCGVPRLKSACAKLDELLRKQEYENIHHPLTELLEAIGQLIKWHGEHDLNVIFEISEQA